MKYYYPFGETVRPLVQIDRSPKKVFVLGVYASAVHAQWTKDGKVLCHALAVASEPRIFWDGDPQEAADIIDRIHIPEGLGSLQPAKSRFNGPSAQVLDNNILVPLGFTRNDAWLCYLLPETRLNRSQVESIKREYKPRMKQYGLNEVNIPKRPTRFCDQARSAQIVSEIEESQARMLILLGDVPILQFLNRVANVRYKSLQEYIDLYGYGNCSTVTINGKLYEVLPLAHPRHIGALGSHSSKWFKLHQDWENSRK